MAAAWMSGRSPAARNRDAGRRVVAQVLADAGQFMHHGDADLAQVISRADAREQEQLGRGDGSTADDDFVAFDGEAFTAAFDLDAHRPVAVEDHPASLDVGAHRQVEAMARQVQVSQRRADPHSVQGVAGSGRYAGRLGVILVRVVFEAQGETGRFEGVGVGKPFVRPVTAHRDGAFGAVPVVMEVVVVFHAAEEGEGRWYNPTRRCPILPNGRSPPGMPR